ISSRVFMYGADSLRYIHFKSLCRRTEALLDFFGGLLLWDIFLSRTDCRLFTIWTSQYRFTFIGKSNHRLCFWSFNFLAMDGSDYASILSHESGFLRRLS